MSPRRGEIWSTTEAGNVLVVSSTVYNEIPSEPTVIVMPVFGHEADTGFGVEIGTGWVATGLITAFDKDDLVTFVGAIGIQELTNVNNTLFKILATPD
ncbi:type II toxin-antitoxin system PemK/MazF family toxin [Mycobacterium sp. NPDC003449]